MAALIAPRLVPTKGACRGPIRRVPVAASTKIQNGSAVMLNASGYAAPAAALAGNEAFVVPGIALETVDNLTGANGDLEITVQGTDEETFYGFNNHGSATVTIAHIGKAAYLSDDNTVANAQVGGTATRPVGGWIHSIEDGLVYIAMPGRFIVDA